MIPSCHPDRKYHAKNLCSECYKSRWIRAKDKEYRNRSSIEWQKSNKGRANLNARRSRILRTYGLTIEQYEAGRIGNCEICGEPSNRLFADHPHSKRGVLRGWLCSTCNLGLGYFMDNPNLLRKAAEYVS